MRNRLILVVLGLIVVGVSLAGLLGVLDIISNTKPTSTGGAPSADSNVAGTNSNLSGLNPGVAPGLNLPSISNLPAPNGVLGPGNLAGLGSNNQILSAGNLANAENGLSLDISPQGSLPPHIPIFNVSGASNVSFLRCIASSSYENDLWKLDPGAKNYPYLGERLIPQVTNFSRLTTSQIKVTPLQTLSSGTVPVPTSLYPVSVSSSTPLTYFSAEQTFISQKGLPESYSFQSINYTFDPAILTKASVDPDPKYLQLPSDTSERTKQLAQEITSGISSPYQKAKAIENYLKTNYTYDFDYKRAPTGHDPNDWFLFDEKKGVCSNFNSAFVELARSVGIPSRLVSGYAIDPTPNQQEVYADQAHAWAEAKFKDLNWITFDATGTSPKPASTKTNITSVSPVIRKGHAFNVQGTVLTSGGEAVDGVPLEIFVNTQKATTGGTKIGQGTVTNGLFNIDCIIPDQIVVGNYQLLAHSLGGIRYQDSWSDPPIKVTTETKINLDVAQKVRISEPVHIQGSLMEESDQVISGQKIGITIGDQPVKYLNTNKDGQFSIDQLFNQPGDFAIKANYDNTEYYLSSSQVVHVTVLIPTILTLQVPPRAELKDTGIIKGSLLESHTGKSVPSQAVQIIINGKPLNSRVVTDNNGIFKAENAFEKAGIYQIEAKFASVPYYWESQAGAVTEISSEAKTPLWLWPAIVSIIVALGLGGFFWFRRQRRKSDIDGPISETSITEVVSELTHEEDNHLYGITLSIEFPKVEATMPDVWGVGEDLEVICRLINSDGIPLAAKKLDFLIGKSKSVISTNANGIGTLRCTFSKKGQFKLTARFNGEPGIEKVSVNRIIRIVDYREEIVDLFNALLEWLRYLGINLAPKATPREIKQAVLQARKFTSEEPFCLAIDCFEEADYSIHPVRRDNYKNMYRAQREIREQTQTSAANW